MEIVLLCSLYVLSLLNYQPDKDKFVGKWGDAKSTSYSKNNSFVIRKNGNLYIMSKVSDVSERIILTYNNKDGSLTGSANGANLVIKYKKESNHLTLGLAGETRFIELKKEN